MNNPSTYCDQHRFMLTAINGQSPGGGLVYDNQLSAPDSADLTTSLGGGSIQIHH